MGKLQNMFLANTKVTFSSGEVQFDEKGIAEVEPDELYQEVLKINNFHAIDEDGKAVPKEKVEEEEGEEKEEVKKPKAPTIDPKDFTVDELDAKAEELEIPEEDYPKSATKAVKAAAINSFLAENN